MKVTRLLTESILSTDPSQKYDTKVEVGLVRDSDRNSNGRSFQKERPATKKAEHCLVTMRDCEPMEL